MNKICLTKNSHVAEGECTQGVKEVHLLLGVVTCALHRLVNFDL